MHQHSWRGLIVMEKKIKDDAVTNAKEWFNKPKMTAEVVDALWTPMLRYKKDPNTQEPDLSSAPTLRVKIPFYDGEHKVEIYDVNSQLLYATPDIMAKHNMTQPVGTPNAACSQADKCGSCCFNVVGFGLLVEKFGVTWKLMQCVVKPKASLDRAKCLVQMNSDDKDKLNQQEERER